ncbi:MAG: helix-turn-helix domain-containing protein [Ktedonobacteraceae bacterium]
MANTGEYEKWLNLTNPFPNTTGANISGHVSGRRTDIIEITSSQQSAIILAGAPNIGKSTLIHFLQEPVKQKWSWRDELAELRQQLNLDMIHFVHIDLKPQEDLEESIENPDKLLHFFVKQCICALQPLYEHGKPESSSDLKELYKLVRNIGRRNPDIRCFVMLDAIEQLDWPGMKLFDIDSRATTPQERGIALLEQCGAIRILVDLLDEFTNFGVILSIQSLPRPRLEDQFTLVSADLARFTTITLQTFTWQDTTKLLAQTLKDFNGTWADAKTFKELGGEFLFTEAEQAWLQEQAGTHPYLLQQFCFHTFHYKRQYAYKYNAWITVEEVDKQQLIELINGRLSTFLTRLWNRLQEALKESSQKTRSNFFEFIKRIEGKCASDEIDRTFWNDLGEELHYILSNEGIIRHDPFQRSHYPGATLSQYLVQKVKENSDMFSIQAVSPPTGRGHWLIINRPGDNLEPFPLTELEYRLLKTLQRYPDRCSDIELMKGAWGKVIGKSAFVQRMHHLRKKLKDRLGGIEVIENRYGGLYSLDHPEWFHLE